MTISTTLPSKATVEYLKPTSANTNGGKSYRPTHPELFRVEFKPSSGEENAEAYSSRLLAVKDFAPGSIITPLTNTSLAGEKAYSSVQYDRNAHLELNSDLLFMNHSCDPSVEVYLPSRKSDDWCIRAAGRELKSGEALTFFYPSTEWDMAQAFKCDCGSKRCLGSIRGAKYLSIEDLESRGLINEHIRRLKSEQGNGQ